MLLPSDIDMHIFKPFEDKKYCPNVLATNLVGVSRNTKKVSHRIPACLSYSIFPHFVLINDLYYFVIKLCLWIFILILALVLFKYAHFVQDMCVCVCALTQAVLYRNLSKILIRGIIQTINYLRPAKVKNVCHFTSISPHIFLVCSWA